MISVIFVFVLQMQIHYLLCQNSMEDDTSFRIHQQTENFIENKQTDI